MFCSWTLPCCSFACSGLANGPCAFVYRELGLLGFDRSGYLRSDELNYLLKLGDEQGSI